MLRSLTILTHAQQGLPSGCFLAAMAERWHAAGCQVRLHQGLAAPPPAEAAFLHVDLTRVPADYLALAGRYPRTFNLRPADISKRRISRNLVARDDSYAGPVMVKTDANAFGRPERALALAGSPLRRRLAAVAGRLRPPHYRFYDRKAAVPAWTWRDPALVVERFLPEREGADFVVNQAYCFGRRWVRYRFCAPGPVVKIEQATRIWPLADDVPAQIEERRCDLGLDFGKFDYVVHDDGVAIFDVARTPWLGPPPWNERQQSAVARLAAGLADYR